MAQVKDLLVQGQTKFLRKAYFQDQIVSNVAQGTAPLVVASSTVVSNLNSDYLDGYHASGLFTALSANSTLSITIGGTTLTSSINAATVDGKYISNYYTKSEADDRFVNVAGDTMSGALTVKQYIFGYNYNHAGANAPAFVFDKPGSNYTGIGANGEADTIYFSAATFSNGEASWVTSYKQKWKFNGTIYQENNAVIHSGNIGSQSVSYASSAGNADTIDGCHIGDLDFRYTRTGWSFASPSDNSMTGSTDLQDWVTNMYNQGGYKGHSSITVGAWWWVRSLDFSSPAGTIRTAGAMIVYSGDGSNNKNYKHFLVLDAAADLYGITSNEESWKYYSKFLNNRNYTDFVYSKSTSDSRYLRKDTNDSTPYQYSFTKTDDHAIQVGTIRGRAVGSQTGEYIHLYERVAIGSPSGWGSRNAPSYGLSTYGGAWLATDTGNVTIGGTNQLASAWGSFNLTVGNNTDKVVIGYLNSSTNGVVVGGHNNALSEWAPLNIAGTTLYFRINESIKATLDSNGNFGIGTSTPGYKLHVNGTSYLNGETIISNSIKILPTVWSELFNDYGLASDYTSRYNTEEFLKSWVKYAYAKGAGYTVMSYISPNARGYIVADVYASGINSSSGLPEHITGRYYQHGGDCIIFGTSYGTWYYRTGLDSGNYTSYLGYIGTTVVQASSAAQALTGITAFTFNGASSAGTNYITGTAGRIYFGGNFHIDSLGSNATYINHYTSNNVYLVSGSSQGNVGIGTTSPSYKLQIAGDSYTTGWSRAANGFYIEGSDVHFTHQGNLGEIDMTSNNEFLWGSSSTSLYFNYRTVSRGTTVNNYIWNAGSSDSYATHTMGLLHLKSNSGNWCEGLRIYPYSGWTTILLAGTDAGASGTSANSWSIHNYNGTFYINKNASSEGSNSRAMATSTGWTFGNTSRNSYALNAASFICDSWVRTVGSSGWYNESYGGGIYMSDSDYVRVYNDKRFYNSNTSQYAFYTSGGITVGTHLWGTSTASSWIDGQRYDRAVINVTNSTDANSFWPLIRWTSSSQDRWDTIGVLGNNLYFMSSATSKTDNGYDTAAYFDMTTSRLYSNGLYHTSYGSSAYALTSDGGAALISSMSVNYATSAGNADTVDNMHVTDFYKSGRAYPYGKYDKPWHKVASFTQSISGTQINTGITFYVVGFHDNNDSHGILNIKIRNEANTVNPEYCSIIWSLNNGIDPNEFVVGHSYSGNTVTYNLYAWRNGWSSYNIRKIAEQAWGGDQDVWTLYDAWNGNSNCFANIPESNKYTSSNLTISNPTNWNSIIGKPFNWSGQSGQPTWLWGSNDGTNYYVWNPSNFSVNYANTAERANYLSGHSSNPDNSHPGHGAKVFYSWNIGSVGNDTAGYSTGITIGSHPSDTGYGFQIVQNLWDDRTYTRRYNNGGWQSWKTLAWTSDIPTSLPANGGNADTVDNKHANDFATAEHTHDGRYLRYEGLWSSGSGQNVDDANGMTFVYGDHGSPNGWGILCTFDYTYNSGYKFQLFAEGYSASGMYYRCRSSDRGGWTSWKTVIDDGNIGSQSVNYANYSEYSTRLDGGAIAGWGTLTSSNGFSGIAAYDWEDKGAFCWAGKSGQMYMQVDGWFYQNEGQYRVTDVSETVTALGTNGNYITWTKNGTTNNITVPYANNAGSATNANYFLGCTNTITVAGDANTYYPVMVSTTTNKKFSNIITVWKDLGSKTASYPENHSNGSSSMLYRYDIRNCYWDGNGGYCTTLDARYIYARLVSETMMLSNGVGNFCIWLRGGGTEYRISTSWNISSSDITVYYSSTNVGSSAYPVTIAPRTDIGNGGVYNTISIPCDVKYASYAGSIAWNNVTGKPFNWSGQSGQPTWLWGSNDGTNYYVWNPSNFNVNYANSAGSARQLTSLGNYAYSNLSTDIPTNAVSYKIVASGGTVLGDSQYNVLHIPWSSGDWGTYLLFGANNGRFGIKFKHTGDVRELPTILTTSSSNVTSLDCKKYSSIYVARSSTQTMTLSTTPNEGMECHIVIYNSGSSNITITLPSSYRKNVTSITIAPGAFGEVNVMTINSIVHVRAV